MKCEILFSFTQGTVFVGGHQGIAQFSVERCSSNVVCSNCLSNRDPYCVWAGNSCKKVTSPRPVGAITSATQCPIGKLDFFFFLVGYFFPVTIIYNFREKSQKLLVIIIRNSQRSADVVTFTAY